MVIQTKSVEYMPLFLSLASLVNGICWTAYALIKFDLYITVSSYNQHVKFQSLFTSVRSTVSLGCLQQYPLNRSVPYIPFSIAPAAFSK
jgi:hypothetical protein